MLHLGCSDGFFITEPHRYLVSLALWTPLAVKVYASLRTVSHQLRKVSRYRCVTKPEANLKRSAFWPTTQAEDAGSMMTGLSCRIFCHRLTWLLPRSGKIHAEHCLRLGCSRQGVFGFALAFYLSERMISIDAITRRKSLLVTLLSVKECWCISQTRRQSTHNMDPRIPRFLGRLPK